MAYTYAVETLTDELKQQLLAIFNEYYNASVEARADLSPYDFDWDMYHALERAGVMLIIVARDEHLQPVGTVFYVITQNPHHRTERVATCDGIGVALAHRNAGIGNALCDFAEPLLRARGVDIIVHHSRTTYKVVPMFIDRGYTVIEQVYMKKVH